MLGALCVLITNRVHDSPASDAIEPYYKKRRSAWCGSGINEAREQWHHRCLSSASSGRYASSSSRSSSPATLSRWQTWPPSSPPRRQVHHPHRSVIRSVVDRANNSDGDDDASPAGSIHVAVVPFPDVGLPPSAQSGIGFTSTDDHVRFLGTAELLQDPFRRFLADHRHPPFDAVVSDSLFPWTVDAAAEHGLPRLAFLGTSMFARACTDTMLRNNPFESAADDPAAVVSLPRLPHRVNQRRSQMMDPAKRRHEWGLFQRVHAADQRSYGELFNSFHELEPDYVEHYRTTLRRRAWLVGPVSLASRTSNTLAAVGADMLSPDAVGCLRWLDAMPAASVLYVSFGTQTSFSPEQLRELARGLDLSGKNFVWVMANNGASSAEQELVSLFATASRGYVVRGWAPQVLILNHAAVGGFMTHCGWNSTLEAMSAGVPMVTWPRYADQFQNEKLVVEVLEVGVAVGAEDYGSCIETHQLIAGEAIAESIRRLMGEGDDGTMRKKAKELARKARDAVEKDGSSYGDVGRLMDDLMARRSSVNLTPVVETADTRN